MKKNFSKKVSQINLLKKLPAAKRLKIAMEFSDFIWKINQAGQRFKTAR